MRKILSIVAFVGLFLGCGVVYAQQPLYFTMSKPTTTTMYCTWTAGSITSTADSLTIQCSDSTCVKVLSAVTATSATLTGLTPGTRYVFRARYFERTDSSYYPSNLDTLYTANPETEGSGLQGNLNTPMRGARSWSPSSIRWDTLYVANTGLDSTAVYTPYKYTSVQAKVVSDSVSYVDSCKVLFRVFAGHVVPTNPLRETSAIQTGVWGFKNVAIDSINVTQNGWTLPKLLNLPPCDAFYIRATGQTGNSNSTKVILRLYRNKD